LANVIPPLERQQQFVDRLEEILQQYPLLATRSACRDGCRAAGGLKQDARDGELGVDVASGLPTRLTRLAWKPYRKGMEPTRRRIFAARAVAVVADAVQIGLMPIFAGGAASIVNDALDVIVGVTLVILVG
jgi:hypothetical protein